MQNTVRIMVAGLFATLIAQHSAAADSPPPPSVTRKDLLTTPLVPAQQVTRVEIKEVVLAPRLHAPLHLHPGAVLGVVLEGEIVFQIEGLPSQQLKAGDAFYEPANTHIARFDNTGDKPARFAAFYLQEREGQELVRILPQ